MKPQAAIIILNVLGTVLTAPLQETYEKLNHGSLPTIQNGLHQEKSDEYQRAVLIAFGKDQAIKFTDTISRIPRVHQNSAIKSIQEKENTGRKDKLMVKVSLVLSDAILLLWLK